MRQPSGAQSQFTFDGRGPLFITSNCTFVRLSANHRNVRLKLCCRRVLCFARAPSVRNSRRPAVGTNRMTTSLVGLGLRTESAKSRFRNGQSTEQVAARVRCSARTLSPTENVADVATRANLQNFQTLGSDDSPALSRRFCAGVRPSLKRLIHRNCCDHLITSTAAVEQSARLPDCKPFLRKLQRKAIGSAAALNASVASNSSGLMCPCVPGVAQDSS
jgi:hypothetical protein